MKRLFLNYVTLGSVLLIFNACTTDNEVECPEDYMGALASAEEKMVGEWVLTAIEADKEIDLTDDNEDNPDTNIFAQYSDCQRDGAYAFSSSRGYTFKQGLKASDCERTVNLEGTWQLAGSVLSLVGSCNVQNLPLEFNSDNTEFVFSEDFNVTDIQGATQQTKVSFTYTLQ